MNLLLFQNVRVLHRVGAVVSQVTSADSEYPNLPLPHTVRTRPWLRKTMKLPPRRVKQTLPMRAPPNPSTTCGGRCHAVRCSLLMLCLRQHDVGAFIEPKDDSELILQGPKSQVFGLTWHLQTKW